MVPAGRMPKGQTVYCGLGWGGVNGGRELGPKKGGSELGLN